MRTISLLLICLSLGYVSTCAAQGSDKKATEGTNMISEKNKNVQKLRHLVLFKFKDSATEEEVKRVEQAFAELPSKIPQITDFEWGLNNSTENLDKGFTHGFLLTFNDENGRDIYLPHPDHKSFVSLLEPLIDDVLVFDYFSKTD